MLSLIWNALLVAAAIAVTLGFQAGMIAPGDAFFLAIAVVAVFTGQQLIAREGMAFGDAAASLLTRPDSYGSRFSYLSYVACLVLGTLVTAQVVMLVA